MLSCNTGCVVNQTTMCSAISGVVTMYQYHYPPDRYLFYSVLLLKNVFWSGDICAECSVDAVNLQSYDLKLGVSSNVVAISAINQNVIIGDVSVTNTVESVISDSINILFNAHSVLNLNVATASAMELIEGCAVCDTDSMWFLNDTLFINNNITRARMSTVTQTNSPQDPRTPEPEAAFDNIFGYLRDFALLSRALVQFCTCSLSYDIYKSLNVGTKFDYNFTYSRITHHSHSDYSDMTLCSIIIYYFSTLLIYGIFLTVYKPTQCKNQDENKNQTKFRSKLRFVDELCDSKLCLYFDFDFAFPVFRRLLGPISTLNLDATVMMVQRSPVPNGKPDSRKEDDEFISASDEEREYSSFSDSDNYVPSRPTTPNSTPKKKRTISRRKGHLNKYHPYQKDEDEDLTTPSANLSKKLLTISPCLTPSERIQRRFRTFSQTSNLSSCSQSNHVFNEDKKNGQKLISSNGSYNLDKEKSCHLHYLMETMTSTETDRILSELNSIIPPDPAHNSKIMTIDFAITEDSTVSSMQTDSENLCDIVKHYANVVEERTKAIFKFKSKFGKAQIIKLQNEKQCVPYQSLINPDDSSPVVAIIAIGAPRTLKLKTAKGRRVTHHVALLSGSLTVMTGITQEKYHHSIPKGEPDLSFSEQFCLVFTGIQLSPTSDFAPTDTPESASATETSEDAESVTTEDQTDDFSVTVDTELRNKPDIVIIDTTLTTPVKQVIDETRANDTLKVNNIQLTNEQSDTHTKDPTAVQLQVKDPIIYPDKDPNNNEGATAIKTPDNGHYDAETTVIRVNNKDSILLTGESLTACVNIMSEQTLNDELRRSNLSLHGSADSRRNRLISHLNIELGRLSSLSPENNKTANFMSGVERTLLDNVQTINRLVDEIAALKLDMTNSNKSTSKGKEKKTKSTNDDDLAALKTLNELWEANSKTMLRLQQRMDTINIDLVNAEQQAVDVESVCRKTKRDLQTWYESQFFKKDSEMLKEIHEYINSCKNKADLQQREIGSERNYLPLLHELSDCVPSSRQANFSNSPYNIDTIGITKNLNRSLSSEPSQADQWTQSFPPLSSPSKVPPVIGTHPSPPARDKDPEQLSSRRPQVINITYSEHQPSPPAPTLRPSAPTEDSLEPPRSPPYSQKLNIPEHQKGPRYTVTTPDLHSTQIRTQGSNFSQRPSPHQRPSASHRPPPPQRPSPPQTPSVPQRPPPPQRPSAPQRPSDPQRTSSSRKFTTVLITDSIMRQIPEDALGHNHNLHMIHKTYATGLSDQRYLRDKILLLKPDYIYVHLGINDLLSGRSTKQVLSYYMEFELYVHEHLRNSKLIYSLPLLTNREQECKLIVELRQQTMRWIENTPVGGENRGTLFNSNSNLYEVPNGPNDQFLPTQADGMFKPRGGIHLNNKGEQTILGNFRYVIHDITRRTLNKPRTRRTSR